MKYINVVCTATLAWVLVFSFGLKEQKQMTVKNETEITPTEEVETIIEKETVVEPNKPATDNFSRPRKPCPPGGPGRR